MTTTTDPAFSAGTVTGGFTAAVGALGLGTLLYANQVELKRFTLRRKKIALPGLTSELRILHISDIHYVPGQEKKKAWLKSLASLQPDLVVNTGDNLSHRRAVPEVVEALGPLLEFPGCFVPGSNDYYAPKFKNPLSYLRGPSQLRPDAQTLPTEELFGAFESAGWANLSNAHVATEIAGEQIEFSGINDPHIDLDDFTGWPSHEDQGRSQGLRLGVAHAPLKRVLETFADSGADLVLAGHTHGGQVCLPGGHALVTNCDLPRSQAKGLHTRPRADGGTTHVHVSAGIGTSAKAPIRLFCPPEATLLTLQPA